MVFDVAAFTNLSRDHLDFHGTMDAYFEAKASLFTPERSRTAVVFADDPWGARLVEWIGADRLVAVRSDEASAVALGAGSTTFTWRGRQVALPMSGRFNVDNALVAAAVALALGVEEDDVATGLTSAHAVPGRMELVGDGGPVAVFVDYAHTPVGLDVALTALRAVAGGGRVVCVFGCGGDRDRGKRPEMGAVASALADVVVVTSDNPRSEDPSAIIDQVLSGMTPRTVDGVTTGATVTVEPDRAAAIRQAIRGAAPGDVVLVAGKGHETTQTVGGTTVPFDDREEAAAALAERFGRADG